MISAVQVQQASQAAITAPTGFATSCTPHLPDYRWHVHFGDFEKICGHEVSADALRAFEMMTNARIARLRESASIPDGTLPHENDLWIEASAPDVDFWTLHVQDQSTYSFCLREKTEPNRAKSLLELGFLRRRFVAYPGRYAVAPVATTVYLDVLGNSFIVVGDDKQGHYVGVDGELHSAADEGYTVMRRQYLYCVEAINAALARLAGQSPPVPMPRWRSLQKLQKKGAQETTKSTLRTEHSLQTTAAQGLSFDDEIKDVKAGESKLCVDKHNINDSELSSDLPEKLMSTKKLSNNSVSLHSAPWSPETLIALSSYHLAVPDPAQCDEEQWRRDWLEPAQWLIDFTAHLDCSRAWEDIEQYVCAMIAGPTWHARKANKPFVSYGTLRHVVGWHKETLQLDGHNWKSTAEGLRKEPWDNYEHIAYAGPPLFDECAESSSAQTEQSYAQGYTAQSVMAAQPEELTAQSDTQTMETAHYVESTAQILESTAQTDSVVEVVAGDMQNDDCALRNEQPAQSVRSAQGEEEAAQSVEVESAQCAMETEVVAQSLHSAQLSTTIVRRKRRTPGMLRGFADTLFDQVSAAHPLVKLRMYEVATGYYLVRMQLADEQWYTFERFSDWEDKSPETQLAIDAAERYAQQRNAAQSNDGHTDSQGPPGYDEVSEGDGGER